MENLEKVIRQDWDESERGWGCRSDGCSLHLSIEDRDSYVRDYWSTMPDEAPDEYERPEGEPYAVYIEKELYDQVAQSSNGIRLSKHKLLGCSTGKRIKMLRDV